MAATTTARPAARSTVTCSWQAFEPLTAAVCGQRPGGRNVHERLVGVRLPARRRRDHRHRRPPKARRRRGEDAARHRREHRREGQRAAVPQRLRHLGHVLVGADLVRGQVPHHFAAEEASLATGRRRTCRWPRRPRRRPARRGRRPATGGARGSSPSDSNPAAATLGRARDLGPCARQLRQAVRPRAGVRAAVGPLPVLRVAQAVVRAEVDHPHPLRERSRQRR